MKRTRLENWFVSYYPRSPYMAPEQLNSILCGDVYNHPKHSDGQFIETSIICEIRKNSIKTYSGTVYYLGKVDERYEATYPNARERLFKDAPRTIYEKIKSSTKNKGK